MKFLVTLILVLSMAGARADTLLWQIGKADDSAAEFSDYRPLAPETINTTNLSAKGITKGLSASNCPRLALSYSLLAVPKYGVMFSFKLLDAHKNGEQLAVFSNKQMSGLIQLWGTGGSASAYKWLKTYRLYIPREMLLKGKNTLELRAPRATWMDEKSDTTNWIVWDYLKMEALTQPAIEPIHGAMRYLGTTLKQSANDFIVDKYSVAAAQPMFEWMGIAYSQNTIRTDFWWDVTSQQPSRLEYLQKIAELNLTVCMNYLSSAHYSSPDGSLPPDKEKDLREFFTKYQKFFQYYELVNEPGNFRGVMAGDLAMAKLLNIIKPSWVKTTAPGWAYAPGGTPKGYPQRVEDRRTIESLCQATNGHSYGFSYNDDRGGSFMEQLKTFQGVKDGWTMEFVNTETGNNNWHSEQNGGTHLPSRQTHASNFERIMRAHIAVVDRAMQHASIFDDFGLFAPPTNWGDMTTLSAYPGVEGEDTRLKTYRRLALTYCTHGKPLPYVVLNKTDITGKMVYCRFVDTSTLAPLPGNGGTSNKVLLNFVNWEETPQTVSVRITMPKTGAWSGRFYTNAPTLKEAMNNVKLTAVPTITVTLTLKPLDCVQYILTPGARQNALVTQIPSPDLVVTGISMEPNNPAVGVPVLFSAVVKNIGEAPTPKVTHGLAFYIDGVEATWADTYSGPLAPGETVTLTANNGAKGKTWTAIAGSHDISAKVDDVDRIRETNEANNTKKITVNIK